jgi:hypothetical protein
LDSVLLMAVRSAEDVESEPVVVHLDESSVRVVLDDGTELTFALDEPRRAVD